MIMKPPARTRPRYQVKEVKRMDEQNKVGAQPDVNTAAQTTNQEGKQTAAQNPATAPETAKSHDESKPTAQDFMIPKHRFDEVSAKNKELEAKILELQGQLNKPADTEDWKAKYDALVKENQEKEAAAAAARRRETIMNSIGSDAHDKSLVYDLLKLETIKVEGDKVEGLAEQLKELKKTKPFLFKPAAQVAKPASQGQSIAKSFGKQLAEQVAAVNTKPSNYFKN